MVRKRLQDITIPYLISMAVGGDALEFPFQRPQLCNLVADDFELSDGDLISINARTVRMSA
jgi:hypothetical protein